MSDYHLFDVVNSIDNVLADGKTIIGRSPECDIRLISSSVSRKHGEFECTGNTLSFSDLGSSNGSTVNGQKVTAPVELKHGDELVMGDLHFKVSQDSGAAEAPAAIDEDATQIVAPASDTPPAAAPPPPTPTPSAPNESEIPNVWSESVGLENASGTQFFSGLPPSEAVGDYQRGTIGLPPLGESPRLAVINGELKAQVFELKSEGDTQTWKIGRDANSVDLVISDASVSGQHAQLVREGLRWKIVNWMSTNGTFVNGNKGLSTYLQNGDIIRMGGAEMVFETPQNAGKKSDSSGGLFSRLFGRK